MWYNILTAKYEKLIPVLALIEALKKEAGISVAPAVAAPAAAPVAAHGPIHVTVASDKAPAEMRDNELLAALAASPREREVLKELERRSLKVVAIDGSLSTGLTLDMWNSVIQPDDSDEFWIDVQNRIVNPWDLGSQMVLLCPVTQEVLRAGNHQKTHTKWGTDVEVLTAARWASTAGKLGNGDVIAQHAAWLERETVLRAEFDQKCKIDPNLRAQVRAQVEQLHRHKKASTSPATRKVTRGGSGTIDSEDRLLALNEANRAQEELTNRMHYVLSRMLRSEFDVLVFRLGIPTSSLRQGVSHAEQVSDAIHYMLSHGRIAELSIQITRTYGSDAWLTAPQR